MSERVDCLRKSSCPELAVEEREEEVGEGNAKNNSSQQAALLALKMLKQKELLAKENEQLRLYQCGSDCERLKQENHTLTRRLETAQALLLSSNDDVDSLHNKLTKIEQTADQCRSENHKHLLEKLRRKCDELTEELVDFRGKYDDQSKELRDLRREANLAKRRAINLSDDSLENTKANRSHEELKLELETLAENNKNLQDDYCDLEFLLQTANGQNQALENDLQAEREKAEEFMALSNEYRREAELAKERNVQLTAEVQAALGQQKIARKGNSVFAELNDHRLRVESEILNLNGANEKLRKELKRLRTELQSEQDNNFLLMTMANSGKDRAESSDYVKQLNDEIKRLRGELRLAQYRQNVSRSSFFGPVQPSADKNRPKFSQIDAQFVSANYNQQPVDGERFFQDFILTLQSENTELKSKLAKMTETDELSKDKLLAESQKGNVLKQQLQSARTECDILRKNLKDLRICHGQTKDGPTSFTNKPYRIEKISAIPVDDSSASFTNSNNNNNTKQETQTTLLSSFDDISTRNSSENLHKESTNLKENINLKTVKFDVPSNNENDDLSLAKAEDEAPRKPKTVVRGTRLKNVKTLDNKDLDTSAGECKQQ